MATVVDDFHICGVCMFSQCPEGFSPAAWQLTILVDRSRVYEALETPLRWIDT